MADIIVFRFFFPILMVILISLPMIGMAVDTKSVVNLAAREGARKAAVVHDLDSVEQRVEDTITGSGKKLSFNGTTLFDKTQDVTVDFYDGDHCTVTVHYRCYLISPRVLTLIGGGALGPTLDMQESASFEREW